MDSVDWIDFYGNDSPGDLKISGRGKARPDFSGRTFSARAGLLSPTVFRSFILVVLQVGFSLGELFGESLDRPLRLRDVSPPLGLGRQNRDFPDG